MFLDEGEFTLVQNKSVLVKDFYKLIKEPEKARRIALFNEVSEKPVFKSKL